MGEMELILFPKVAPKAVENFVKHAKDGYYEGIIFHRVIEGFMIQGGDPTGTGRGGESIWKKSFEDEFDVNYRNFYGALSMANAGPNTNGSQFFIVTAKNNINDNLVGQMKKLGEKGGFPDSVIDAYKNLGGTPHLDAKHTVFGHVVKGMDVAEKISKVERNSSDKPIKDVVIEKITIEE
ncbi:MULTISPECIES: peptidylprolyl isomerase [Helcococcus]